MKKIMLMLVCVSSLFAADTAASSTAPYKAKDFSYLMGMPGFGDQTMKNHFKLYQGYVNTTNKELEILKNYANTGKSRTVQFGAMQRRLMWNFDGMRLHELYFSNLGGHGTKLDPKSALYKRIVTDFGSYESWKEDFLATGAMRGIGWSILYQDPYTGRLINVWINEHDTGHLAGGTPILIMDVWEHAYLLDYGLDRGAYMNAFFNNIQWDVVSGRYPKQPSK